MKQETCRQESINADDIAEKWRKDADKAQAEHMLDDIIGTADELERHVKDVRADLVMMIKALIEKDERYGKLIMLASSLFDLLNYIHTRTRILNGYLVNQGTKVSIEP